MAASSFALKVLRVTLILAGEGAKFPGTQSNKLTLTGLTATAKVKSVNRLSTTADVEIYGMKRQDMDAVTVAWATPPIILDHVMIVEADSGNGFLEVFRGTIIEAQPNYAAAPNVSLTIQARTGYFQQVSPASPISWDGDVTIVNAAKAILDGSGFAVVDGGAKGVLQSPYFAGTRWEQLSNACAASNTDWYVLGNQVLLTAFGKPRDQQPTVVLARETGLIGYPSYERVGLAVRCLFDPAILCGAPIEIRGSIVPSANGKWFPQVADHLLEGNTVDGAWESRLFCLRVAEGAA
jgi:hypothetical protein